MTAEFASTVTKVLQRLSHDVPRFWPDAVHQVIEHSAVGAVVPLALGALIIAFSPPAERTLTAWRYLALFSAVVAA